MTNDTNIPEFTAIDIEKYHQGLLSPKEMHAMEKAALEDPFLADAMEGYMVTGVHAQADLEDLKNRLADKTHNTKVVPLYTAPHNNFFWLRVAAMIIIIAGAGLLVYQFKFTGTKKDIAETTIHKKEQTPSTDTIKEATIPTASATDTTSLLTTAKEKGRIEKDNTRTGTITLSNTNSGNTITNADSTSFVITANKKKPAPVIVNQSQSETVAAPGYTNNAYYNAEPAKPVFKKNPNEDYKAKRDYVKAAAPPAANNISSDSAVAFDKNVKLEEVAIHNNFFRGRVTDANNIPVPFANITNTVDNVGTYSDAKGNFNLISSDSVLNVQVRSIGFDNNTVKLHSTSVTNQVVLQDDRKSLSEVVISNKKPNAAARSRDNNMKLQEPEPEDGWDNYDSYLVNNLNVPEDILSKKTSNGEVEVSFEVDINGEPTNIKVEKSLCSKCDKEAIRLIKEGPKWKRIANKKGRTTVVINF